MWTRLRPGVTRAHPVSQGVKRACPVTGSDDGGLSVKEDQLRLTKIDSVRV